MRQLLSTLFIQSAENQSLFIFSEIEMKILPIFAMMEFVGIGFNEKICESGREKVQNKINYLEYKAKVLLPGKVFSLSSTEDISQLLFQDLKIPVPEIAKANQQYNGNKGGGGCGGGVRRQNYSTKGAVLEHISHHHPLPGLIIEIRKLTHHITHYVDILGKYEYHSDRFNMRRIYSTIQQTVVPTGRISMAFPNLQNISHPIEFRVAPSETDLQSQDSIKSFQDEIHTFDYTNDQNFKNLLEIESRCSFTKVSLRNSFTCANGYVLLSADYSQLELRILTHYSKDPNLIEMFNYSRELDVFKCIAHQLSGVDYEKVSDEERNFAKHLVYGILYGMGINSIASELKVDKEKAKVQLERFKNTYRTLIDFLESIEDRVFIDAYIKTLFGRIRNFSAIHDPKTLPKDIGKIKRGARNSVPQGTAADITKLAMINIQSQFDQLSINVHMVLQLHDELLFEVPLTDIDQSAKIIKESMENVVKLNVPLPIKMSIGTNWGSLESFNFNFTYSQQPKNKYPNN
ncbi:hypothetical protein DDB_G0277751 [Dictyostelium discoideum AX4]|uniref:DNA-directed DNA polymerase n=1 Tax=Dictyostelium discoideum TaxID=44689 RepID=Q86KS9_DICDI|nr:hypothetical protein DDB_G0277751 [Dictyostelium discoideum AX4]EAL68549.1 hypothetical protein DDB_G0277751 [Dictyostelium discoideum AX4]|eukprot:XP_642487.1 hypothetical protein DDB_G0277751 [Dictyostelium discoideum AX4]